MVSAMKRYVFPPKFDFLTQLDSSGVSLKSPEEVPKLNVNPIAMYIFEFKHVLSQQDITDIWQNLPPRLGSSFQSAESTVSHRLLKEEIMHEMNDSRVQWLVFKVKQKAKTNYYETTADALDDIKFKFNLKGKETVVPAYSYNWPYDYCSIVELAKIEANVQFETKKEN